MRYFVIVLISLAVFLSLGAGTHSESLLLEAWITGSGMTFPQGKRLYLRIYNNGKYEYDSEAAGKPSLRFVTEKSRLDKADLTALSDFLHGNGVQELAKSYEPISAPLDHLLHLTISIFDKGEIQTINIKNFAPTAAGEANPYPKSLIELLCRTERLRTQATFNITADSTKWCSK